MVTIKEIIATEKKALTKQQYKQLIQMCKKTPKPKKVKK
jgi:chromate transport protein ChrA